MPSIKACPPIKVFLDSAIFLFLCFYISFSLCILNRQSYRNRRTYAEFGCYVECAVVHLHNLVTDSEAYAAALDRDVGFIEFLLDAGQVLGLDTAARVLDNDLECGGVLLSGDYLTGDTYLTALLVVLESVVEYVYEYLL